MQVPKRKPGKYAQVKKDPHITKAKFVASKNKLERLKASQPPAIQEVRRLAELGDFSENVAYQMAKGKLRSINQKILELENQINHAVIIEPNQTTGVVELGSIITIEFDDQEQTYQILGSAEANPTKGIISHNSPIGFALMGHRVGDIVELPRKNKVIKYKVIKVE